MGVGPCAGDDACASQFLEGWSVSFDDVQAGVDKPFNNGGALESFISGAKNWSVNVDEIVPFLCCGEVCCGV